MDIYLTEIPYTSNKLSSTTISEANKIIRRLANQRDLPTMNLNSKLAPEGILLPQYTVDGIHFNKAAYRHWREMIAKEISRAELRKKP